MDRNTHEIRLAGWKTVVEQSTADHRVVPSNRGLAEIYGYEVKRLNEQVKNNISRFPEDFMFQLQKEEISDDCSKSKFSALNVIGNKRGSNIKKLPYAFTEQGIYMRATVLRGELAEQ